VNHDHLPHPGATLDRRQLLRLAAGGAVGVALGASILGEDRASAAKKPRRRPVPPTPIGAIQIPRLSLLRSVFEGTALATLNYGPGHLVGTAGLGELGNCVIGGHRTTAGGVFRNINRLAPGDPIVLHLADGSAITYTTLEVRIIRPLDPWAVEQNPLTQLSLFACTKPNGLPTSAKFRIVVRAQA
jgi:LPXTG-site transpeptidase (sortase) family protein